jgi:hypothetical protein
MNIRLYTYIKEYLRHLLAIMLYCSTMGVALATFPNQQAAAQQITLKLQSASIHVGLSALEKKSGCIINYNKPIFREGQQVSIDVKDMGLEQVLTKILNGTRVAFRFTDQRTVLLYKLPDPVKPGKISGKIVDEKGESLPGASVKIQETGQGVQTGVDGSFILNAEPGTYTVMISYISYQTQRITGVMVTEGRNTALNISLKPDTKGLKEVIVTAGYKKATAEGLLARQKNASEISNGISAEQIGRTPDKNIGESLKRIAGVSTMDNKFVLVRGIGERYNSAMLDGVVLPSTEAQSRNFSFDLIPANLVDNVVVSKTVTPDMNASFGGGLIQINTKDIPNEDFTSFTAGVSYNDQTTGKDFLSHKRGKYDYFGFDDGRRKFPKNLVGIEGASREVIDAQSKSFTNDNFTVYKYRAAPSQNYQFSIGRLLTVDTTKGSKFGFTGSVSYRNTQNINVIADQRRNIWDENSTNNTGKSYGFNTTWGALLNAGLQLGKHRFSFRNTYTHLYNNNMTRIVGFISGDQDQINSKTGVPTYIQEVEEPVYTDLLQNKLSGQHQLGKVKIEWDFARTSVKREDKDLGIVGQYLKQLGGGSAYFYNFSSTTEPQIEYISRHYYHNKEGHYSWDIATTLPFTIGSVRSTVKTGYFGNQKKADFKWQIAPLTANLATMPEELGYLPIGEMIKPENMGINGFQYGISPWFLDLYEGKSQNHAGFVMLDNRLMDKLRLVWGLRGEYYKYTEIKNAISIKGESIFSLKPDPRWQWLPSANLTYSPLSSLNIRTAWSSNVVRPELMDNSQFFRYSPYLGGQFGNEGLYSTRINSLDFKTEWFPGLGEILSIGGFYKKFDKPAELVIKETSGSVSYILKSSEWAKVYGLELELRKSFLKNFMIYGNLTLQKSEVKSTYLIDSSVPDEPSTEVSSKQSRPMYGQSPYQINVGLQYTGDHFGFNLAYNKSGYKTYIVSDQPELIEYERSREQLDAQVSYRFSKNRFEIKLNAGNLLNSPSVFYNNMGNYERNPDYVAGGTDISDAQRLKPGFSNKYEAGDRITFSQKFGRTYSTSLSYTF